MFVNHGTLACAATAIAVFCLPVHSETAPAKSVSLEAPQSQTALVKPGSKRSLLGVDADGDGIRDDIEALVARRQEPSADVKPETEPKADKTDSALGKIGERRTVKSQPPRRTCFDYLMMAPKDKYEADLRTRQRTNGLPGTHACDPVVSPLRERPFETDFLHVEIGPVHLQY